jgi:molybdate transport repressor ModE-like protein
VPLSSHVPDIAALELLLDVARTGSIGAAARVHGVSQQAASARLAGLERQVGLTVLDRGSTGSRLTDAGRALVAWADRVVSAAGELDDGVAALRREGSARLRLAASMTVAEHLVPRWLAALRGQTPAGTEPPTVMLTATNSDAVTELVRTHAADLGFVEGPAAPPGLEHRVVAGDRLVLVVPPGHPWAGRRRPVTATELAATPLVVREPGSGTRRALEDALHAALGAGAPLAPPAMEFGTGTAVREAVRAGLGPAVLSDLAVSVDLADGRLVEVPVPGLPLTRRLRAVWAGAPQLPAGPARDLLAIAARRRG